MRRVKLSRLPLSLFQFLGCEKELSLNMMLTLIARYRMF